MVVLGPDVLSGEGAVVHEQKLDVVDVVDEEGLVAGGHHVLGLLVRAVADLFPEDPLENLAPTSGEPAKRLSKGISQSVGGLYPGC